MVVAHTHTGSISHVGPIHIEISEESVRACKLSNRGGQHHPFNVEEMHVCLEKDAIFTGVVEG